MSFLSKKREKANPQSFDMDAAKLSRDAESVTGSSNAVEVVKISGSFHNDKHVVENPDLNKSMYNSRSTVQPEINLEPNIVLEHSGSSGAISDFMSKHIALAPRPKTIADTEIPQHLLEDLLAKMLLESGVSDIQHLSEFSALSPVVTESLLVSMRAESLIEIRSPNAESSGLRYALTETGKKYARDAIERSGYIGPAPVSMNHYKKILHAQSVHHHRIAHDTVHKAFEDMIIKPELLNQLGSAMHSGKAVFIYGSPGTGKTYACQRLARLLGDPILIPCAVAVGDSIVQVFDNLLHKPLSKHANQPLMLDSTHDPRFIECERPFICSGGELSGDLLEIQYDHSTKQYRAPLQLKASNGIYLIDDLGRQKMPTAELFNRWIVPMESGEDFLNMQSGNRMVVPFDLVLMFSTNLNPNDLADAAFLRRIGHKIKFEYLDRDEYSGIWSLVCSQRETDFDQKIVDYVIDELHTKKNVPLLACHPRDIIGIALDHIDYMQKPRVLDVESLHIAWESNFVSFD